MVSKIKHPKTILTGWLGNLKILFISSLLIFSSQVYGQAGEVSQIRNGPADNPQKWFFKNFNNPSWVNGNAGAETAHYVEGMSIGYRSLLTGLTSGTCYEYVIEYDTYHGAMAIDYLTHFQRLEPHSPFGHAAEVIDPRIFKSGNTEYIFGVVNTNTYPIPAPDPSGIASGSTKDISNQPTASFNALPAGERVMTIYNGVIEDITYEDQDPIAISGNTNTSSSVRIRFTADDDSVVLAWGGHIASRLDWGFSTTTGKALSAAGISGSPYHMRQLSMNTCTGTNINLGNQDRSLSAAAVVPPPECPTVASQTKCLDATSFTFTISNPDAETTYTWSFGTNTAGAAFSGGVNTGTSVTIVPSGSAFTAGSFTLNITAVKNTISLVCTGVATGTVVQVVATASADPTIIDLTSAAHSTTLTADIGASSTFPSNADYTYQWTIVSVGYTGILTNADQRIATYTAGENDLTSITFKVTATLNKTGQPACTDDETVAITLVGPGACDVSPAGPVCSGTEVTHNGSPDPIAANTTYKWTIEGYGGSGTTTSTIDGADNGVSVKVDALTSYRIVLTQTYANADLDPAVCFEDVEVVQATVITANYIAPPTCADAFFSVEIPNSVTGTKYLVTQGDPATYSEEQTGDGSTLTFTGLTPGGGFKVTATTATADCPSTYECPAVSSRPGNPVTETKLSAPVDNSLAKIKDIYKIALESPTKVNATPNPFTEKVRFDLVSGLSGYGTLELYNAVGQRVGIVYQGYIQAGRPFVREYSITKGSKSNLIYVFQVGDQKVTGKLINLR